MGYIEKTLGGDEKIVYMTKLHWIIFAWPMLLTILGFYIAFSGADDSAKGAGGFFVFVGIIWVIGSFLQKISSEFGVTSKRVVLKTGLIRRNTVELLISKVEGMNVNQGIFGRIFGYGTVHLTGTGGKASPFKRIKNPMELRRHVMEQTA